MASANWHLDIVVSYSQWSARKVGMQGDRHFSHDHPLQDYEEEDEFGADFQYHCCKICGLPILSSPSYTCTIATCEFFLHKSCALGFCEKIIHPSCCIVGDSDMHTLYLKQKSPNFTYECNRKSCGFKMHPLEAVVPPVEIKTKHKSHPSHPLVAICRESSSMCNACGDIHRGFFFACADCNFWIHRDCTMLPTAVMLPSHPQTFFIAYSFPVIIRQKYCTVCNDILRHTNNAIYFCLQTEKFAHVSCAKEGMRSGTRLELIQLPDEELDTFPSLEIRRYLQISQPTSADDELTIEKFHKHPLILVDEEGIRAPHYKLKAVCDICTQNINISSPFYRCPQGCSFLAHKVCADVIPITKFVFPYDLTQLLCPDPTTWFFNAVFYCFFCRLPCNGPCYYFPDSEVLDDLPIMFDVLCMAAPSIIKHTSHNQHFLYRTRRYSRASPISCCSGDSTSFDVYKCTICDFYIHIRCAFLPKRISHKFDQHPLHLITSTSGTSDESGDNGICEICEECLDHRYWFYHCATCDYSFHINCIPSLGYLSKVKFGGKLSIPSHAHPLTLTRMLLVGRNERCGYCPNIIRGLVDEMAFCCSEDCGFWIHFHCARDSCASKSMIVYEVDEEALCNVCKVED